MSRDIDLAFICLVVILSIATKMSSVSSKRGLTEWIEFIQHLSLRAGNLGFESALELSLLSEERVHEKLVCMQVVVRCTTFTLKYSP